MRPRSTIKVMGLGGRFSMKSISAKWTGAQIVAIGARSRILTSPDGIDWTVRDTGSLMNARSYALTWTGTNLIAVGDSGVILTSPEVPLSLTPGGRAVRGTGSRFLRNPVFPGSATWMRMPLDGIVYSLTGRRSPAGAKRRAAEALIMGQP